MTQGTRRQIICIDENMDDAQPGLNIFKNENTLSDLKYLFACELSAMYQVSSYITHWAIPFNIRTPCRMRCRYRQNSECLIFKMEALFFKMEALFFKMEALFFKMEALFFKMEALFYKMEALFFKMEALFYKMEALFLAWWKRRSAEYGVRSTKCGVRSAESVSVKVFL